MVKTFGDEWLECRNDKKKPSEYLRLLTLKGYIWRYSAIKDKEYCDKALSMIDHELEIIEKMNLSDLFIAVYEITALLNSADVPIGVGRGAVPESIVNYCLGITDVDPIKYNLVFERFLNPDRNQKPFFSLEIPYSNVKLLKRYIIKDYFEYSENIEILPLCAVETVKDTIDNINASLDQDIDLNKLDYADLDVYKSMSEKGTDILYIEATPEYMREFAPKNLEELAAAIAMCREGSEEFIPNYLKAKNSTVEAMDMTSIILDITRETYGNIIYQEQVMRILHDLAGFSWAQSDNLRRDLSKMKFRAIERGRVAFVFGNENEDIEGCIAKDITEEVAKNIYDMLVERTKFTLNKSHFIAYAKMIYQQAWLKHYYPGELIKSRRLQNE